MTSDTPGTRPDDYRYWVDERVRFADLDVLGHVNNVAFAVYAESARAAFFRELGFWEPGARRQNVVVRFEIDYRRELRYPAELRVGLRVLEIGTRSFRVGIGIFAGGECAALAQAVAVRFDTVTRRAAALDHGERERLQAWVVR